MVNFTLERILASPTTHRTHSTRDNSESGGRVLLWCHRVKLYRGQSGVCVIAAINFAGAVWDRQHFLLWNFIMGCGGAFSRAACV